MTLLSQVIATLKGADRPRLTATGMSGVGMGAIANQGGLQVQLASMGTVGWLFAGVDRIASSVAAPEWRLLRRAGRDDEPEAVSDHPLWDLWDRPNPFETRFTFLEASSQHFELTGEIWWLIVRDSRGVPAELWLLRPDRMRPIPHPTEYIAGYEYAIGGARIFLEREDVIFIKRPSPLDPYRGIGTVQAMLVDLGSERLAARWNRAFFENDATPGGIIRMDESMSDPEFDKAVQRWNDQHRGVSNAHRVAFIERGTFQERKYTMRDMQFGEMRRLSRDLILGALGISSAILGVSENVNRANAEASEVMFSRRVLVPRLTRIQMAANTQLAPAFDPSLYFEYVDPTPADRQLALDEAERGYKAGVLTRNEARRRLGEPEADEGGDEFAPVGGGPAMLSLPDRVVQRAPNPLHPDDVNTVEQRMEAAWARRLAAEAKAIGAFLEQFKSAGPRRKLEVSDVGGYDWDWWARFGDEIVAELLTAFAQTLTEALPDWDPQDVQRRAGLYARARGARLLKIEGDLNLVQLTRSRVNELVARTLERGDSLQALQKALREDFAFSRQRATMVSRTETATALGQGQKEVALFQDRDEKHWVTQGGGEPDECYTNEAAGWIPVGDPFPSGKDTIPEHPNCMCVVRYRRAEVHAESVNGTLALTRAVATVNCIQCGRRLPTNNVRGMCDVYCKNCDKVFEVRSDEAPEVKHTRKRVDRDDDGHIEAVEVWETVG